MVSELQRDYNSVVTVEDFQNYTAIEREVVTSHFDDLEVIGVPPPASGAVLGLILNILDGRHQELSLPSSCDHSLVPRPLSLLPRGLGTRLL